MLEELHNGHCGMVRMKALSRSYVWWPGLDEDISMVVKECAGCQSVHSLPAKAPTSASLGLTHISMAKNPCRLPWTVPWKHDFSGY